MADSMDGSGLIRVTVGRGPLVNDSTPGLGKGKLLWCDIERLNNMTLEPPVHATSSTRERLVIEACELF